MNSVYVICIPRKYRTFYVQRVVFKNSIYFFCFLFYDKHLGNALGFIIESFGGLSFQWFQFIMDSYFLYIIDEQGTRRVQQVKTEDPFINYKATKFLWQTQIFLISISLKPNVADLWYIKIWILLDQIISTIYTRFQRYKD